MITKAKIKNLGKQLIRKSGGQRETVVRRVTEDGIYYNEEGYPLSEEEVKRIKKENKEVSARGGLILNLHWFKRSKVGDGGAPKIEK